ncbi:MAG TPA: type II toxin-antitoxin system PemK/MazF family toxin [Saprospiraceae bacterium]|nr:type II toxin-antitoxin system PemK/MazF family toxin [Saprospiraceae bacterium]
MKFGSLILSRPKELKYKKKRPAIIVNDDSLGRLPLKIIVPVTDWKDRYDVAPWMVKITPNDQNGLSKISCADCFQIRSVSQQRFILKIGVIDSDELLQIKDALKKVLDI